MKQSFLLLVALLLLGSTFAQKVYATKAAQVKFFSHTPTEDISAINNQAVSKLVSNTGDLMFSVLIKGFRFENELMQEHFNGADYMNSTKFPKGEFKGKIANIATVNFAKDGIYKVTATGTLTIKGVTKNVLATGSITVAKGIVSTKSAFKINVKNYGVDGSDVAKNLEITVTAKYE
ncbi:MAG: YceI family protein [Flavobacterium sp.]|nr:YceI family protein [Flavobacterium sp.]